MSETKKVENSKKFFAPKNKNDRDFQSALKSACRSLTFISETDADVVPFTAVAPDDDTLGSYLAALGITSNEIEERGFESFFDRLTRERDWHGAIEKQRSRQWSKLREIIEKHLKKIRVIRVGRVRLDIYVVGLDESGRLAGVKTKAIET